MEEKELNEILNKIENEMTGDPEHDAETLNEWGERYREQPGSEPLLKEIGRRIFDLMVEEDPDMPQQIFNNMVETADEDYEEALRLIDQKQYDEALGKLLVLSEVIRNYPLSEDTVWMDFDSRLDAMVFQDYYQESIGEKEIRRHPMHPSHMLFTAGSLLIEMNRPEEAVEILQSLLSYDPVCPRFLFEMGEAYKRTGQLKEAVQTALWALSCASKREELARAYRDIAYCLTETEEYEDAVMLYMLSLRYQASRHAEAEIAWIQKKSGVSALGYNSETIRKRCEELNIPIGINETVKRNIELLNLMDADSE